MKIMNYISTILIAIFCVSLFSCKKDLLDTQPSNKVGEDAVWSSRTNADAFVNGVYSSVLGGLYSNYADLEQWTVNSVNTTGANSIVRETFDRNSDFGFNQFVKIRSCNLIIEKASASTSLSANDKKELVATGKFLRAMTYFYLAKRFGRPIWVDRVLTEKEATYALPQTESIAKTYQLIMADIDAAVDGLPLEAPSGLATKDAANALKSEVALQAAAYTGEAAYYQKAVDAANAVLTGGRHPLCAASEYEGMFNEKGATNQEIILATYRSKTNTICADLQDLINMVPNQKNGTLVDIGYGPLFKAPFVIFEAWLDFSPSQNLVDQYLVIDNQDGKAKRWNETSQFTANITQNPDGGIHKTGGKIHDIIYNRRDARFEATIVRDEAAWFGEVVATKAKGNLNSRANLNGGLGRHIGFTNYYWRKGIYNVSPRVYWNIQTDYHWVIFRTGRVILNKAEALLRQDKISEAVNTLNLTRVAHGSLPGSTATALADAWTDYKRERRVELAKENDYYWSLLRWGKYGGEANSGRAQGDKIVELEEIPYSIEINESGTSYSIVPITQNNNNVRVFSTRRYLFPIPFSSVIEKHGSIVQNPGW